MACEICEHCQYPINNKDTITKRKCWSYHKECHKCYVCSETNLRDAEVFKGVIFCFSCSHRIFQCCSTVRQIKVKSNNVISKLPWKTTDPSTRVLDLANMINMYSDSKSHDGKTEKDESEESSDLFQNGVPRRISTDRGMSTDVTQELLRLMNGTSKLDMSQPVKRTQNRCSDLRIDELGTSTEIANMALTTRTRKPEKPLIIRSRSLSSTDLAESTDCCSYCLSNSTSFDDDSDSSSWSDDEGYQCVFKQAYKKFKRSILKRSSVVSDFEFQQLMDESMSSIRSDDKFKSLKNLFKENPRLRRSGLKKLYSSINRQKSPLKLGWKSIVARVDVERNPDAIWPRSRKCKHYTTSTSYRCMRKHVMQLAGPTKSELYNIRRKFRIALPKITLGSANNITEKRNQHKKNKAYGNEIKIIKECKTATIK